MKSVRVLYMWAPLGRKKQLPGLTSLKKNSSWSCSKTCKLDLVSFGWLCVPLLPFRCVCDLSSPPPPAPSPIPACPSPQERPHLGDAPSPGVPPLWPGWLMTAGMFQIRSNGTEREKERERKNNEPTPDKNGEGQPEKGLSQHVWWLPLCLQGKRTGNWSLTNTISSCWYFHGIPLCPVIAQYGNPSLPLDP